MTASSPGPGERIRDLLLAFAPPFVGGLLLQQSPVLGLTIIGLGALAFVVIKVVEHWDALERWIPDNIRHPAKIWEKLRDPRIRIVALLTFAALVLGFGTRILWNGVFPAPCPTPTELPVLTSAEGLGPLQDVIPAFERYEARRGCFAVHVYAYSIGDREQTRAAFLDGWRPDLEKGLLAGPRPYVWIPDSSYELQALGPAKPRFGKSTSIGDSPLAIAMPTGFADQYQNLVRGQQAGVLYNNLHTAGDYTLTVSNPLASDPGLLFLTALDQGPLAAQNRSTLAQPGDFPPDSKSLLCDNPPAGTGYLITELTLRRYDDGLLCGDPGAKLSAFYPGGVAKLDFPFTTVDWGDNQTPEVRAYEARFLAWLTGAGRPLLCKAGLRVPDTGCPAAGFPADDPAAGAAALPATATAGTALKNFQRARPPAHVVIGMDDSGPMAPYLPKITSAITRVLAPQVGPGGDQPASPVGGRDSFSIWTVPGTGTAPEDKLVQFKKGTLDNRQAAESAMANVTAHSHSADYDMLFDAANDLYLNPEQGATNAVILLTDGDGAPNETNNAKTVAARFASRSGGASPVRLFLIAFGPGGCSGVIPDLRARTCTEIKDPADIQPALAGYLKQIATGG
jgi:hypothetical protein